MKSWHRGRVGLRTDQGVHHEDRRHPPGRPHHPWGRRLRTRRPPYPRRRRHPHLRHDLWDAITSPERIPRWFLPITGELRLGGRYQLQGNAGGQITRCEPPRILALTWEFGGEVSWVDVVLEEDGDGARLHLEHTAHVDDDRWRQFGPGAVGVGWDLTLLGLGLHVAGGETRDPAAEGAAWARSDEGKAFIRRSSDAWRAASVAAGTDPAEAAKAAAGTTAFYTGDGGEGPPADPTDG
ncbi:MAG: SRPBCC family protein [Nannocystaceae bacterium]